MYFYVRFYEMSVFELANSRKASEWLISVASRVKLPSRFRFIQMTTNLIKVKIIFVKLNLNLSQ